MSTQKAEKTGGFASLHLNFSSRLSRTTSRKVITQKYNLGAPIICQDCPARLASLQMQSIGAVDSRAICNQTDPALEGREVWSKAALSWAGLTRSICVSVAYPGGQFWEMISGLGQNEQKIKTIPSPKLKMWKFWSPHCFILDFIGGGGRAEPGKGGFVFDFNLN